MMTVVNCYCCVALFLHSIFTQYGSAVKLGSTYEDKMASSVRNPTRCYQCAFTPDKTEVEEIKVPRVVKEEVDVPTIIKNHIEIPRVIWEEVKRPRIINDEQLYYDDSTWQWKVGRKTRQVYERVWVSRQVYEAKELTKTKHEKQVRTKQIYDVKKVTKRKFGGWQKCMGPFDEGQARQWGIDIWDCDNNCYTKVDTNGNVVRGCYNDEFGVNPNKLGCEQVVAGARYCFCEGNYCNRKKAPNF